MSDQSKLGLGKIITSHQERDAIHVAVVPVVAGEKLQPGTHVGLRDGKAVSFPTQMFGVVDPFLKRPVQEDQTFWLFLYPGSITSLRHEWTHPAFPVIYPKSESALDPEGESRRWMEGFAHQVGYSYGELIERMTDVIANDGGWVGDDDAQDRFNDVKTELLFHASRVIGVPMPNPENVYFSCAC